MFGKNYDNAADHGLKVGDRVCHLREPDFTGTIIIMEDNKLSCMVRWDYLFGDGGPDFAWCNKLIKIV